MDAKGIFLTAITLVTAGTISYVVYKYTSRAVKKEVTA